MPMRFLVQTPVDPDEPFALNADRAHYLTRVMRHKTGDVVECFDGNGAVFEAQLIEVNSRRCTLRVTEQLRVVQPPAIKLHLGISLLKGQAMDRAVQQATELGASSIRLLEAKRSNVQLRTQRLDRKMDHWQKIIAGACEQSGRLFLPKLIPPASIAQVLAATEFEIIVLDMHGEPLPGKLPAEERLLLMGPEGGWDATERQLFVEHKLTHYRLSSGTLRAETVPSVALALFSHLQQL
ncbi:MAG: RsmE family RNA methyltransferase [bacterium]